ncbi:hypothetical protein LCGC14_0725880 [marine sediment metagenome]|uniref:Uncharacterized protein n=1 Tax=marine sediment metagenome TaxID=412755 RepID=A0A0F9QW31_9ZZZZ
MKTNKKDHQLFKKECKKWHDILNLKNWEIYFVHGDTDNDCRAQLLVDQKSRLATVYLAEEWESDVVTELLIKKTAFHEMCELFLYDVTIMLSCFFASGVVEEEIHKIIRTLENTLFLKY